jgi:hypothetical protein
MKEKLLKIIRQPSTWRGLFMTFAGGYGLYKHGFDITYVGLLTAGIIGLVDDDTGKAVQIGLKEVMNGNITER